MPSYAPDMTDSARDGGRSAAARPVALAAVAGGAAVWGLVAVSARWVAELSYPTAFGLTQTGDTAYPFPLGEAVFVVLGIFVVGLVGVGLLVRWSRRQPAARAWAIGWCVAAGVTLVRATDGTFRLPRCGLVSYSSTYRCISEGSATLRDVALVSLPFVIAGIGLAAASWRRPVRCP
jgi:hypothetical protein